MARDELAQARDAVESAAEQATDDAADRLEDVADQLDTLVDRDQDPDHGRLARIQNALSDLKAEVGEEAEELIDEAKDHVSDFRKTIEGV